jgi:hypothetical protein
MGEKFWYDKIADLIFLISIGSLGFIFKYLWSKSMKAYSLLTERSWDDKFEVEIKKYADRIQSIENDLKILVEDKKIKEAISKALEEKQYKNGLQ